LSRYPTQPNVLDGRKKKRGAIHILLKGCSKGVLVGNCPQNTAYSTGVIEAKNDP